MTLDRQEVVDSLPQYEIGPELGRGGWGVVLGGRHRHLDREVAIKQLPRAFAADPAVRARFVAEARVLASLDHPHVVPVYDYVERDGLCLLVMELLPGGTVWSRFVADGFTPSAACAVALASAAGLQAAHDHNVLHRDVKPENLMFSRSGVLKITDFGIAKVLGGEETFATRAGEVVGTPAYIAPEQAQGGPLSPATDVYALATMVYELLSGQLPFPEEGDAMALLFRHAFGSPTPLVEAAPSVPPPISEVLMRGLATSPGDRFQSASAFGLALAEACTAAWGPGWLSVEQVPVMGAAAIVAATEHVTPLPSVAGLASAAVGGGTPVSGGTGRSAPQTIVRQSSLPPGVGPPGPPPPPIVPEEPLPAPRPEPRAPVTRIRPSVRARATGVSLVDVDHADLVPLKEVVKPPPKPLVPLAIAAAALVMAAVVALVGIGSPVRGGDLPAGTVTVGGVDPTTAVAVPMDLAAPVPIRLSHRAPAANRVRLSLLVLGRPVSWSEAVLSRAGKGKAAGVDAGGARFLVPERVTGEVELLKGRDVVGKWRFAARTAQSSLLTAPAGVVLVLILFAGAYAESYFRSLRRGRRRVSATVGSGVMGVLLGVAIVGIAWLVAGREPTVPTVVASGAFGLVAGTTAAIGQARIGRGRRIRAGRTPVPQRQERAA